MNAWLTQILLDTRSRQVRDDLADVVAMHRRVMKLIPDRYADNPRHAAGVLYRVEDDNRRPRLLVQTRVEPDSTRLPTGMGSAQTKRLAPLLAALHTGLAVHYRLVANTSKRLAKNPNASRHAPVVPLRGADAELWWTRRAPECGLSLRTVHMRPMPDLHGRRGERDVRHAATRFDGIAVVEDPDALRSAVLTGIGRAKSYGCGLLSLAPMGDR